MTFSANYQQLPSEVSQTHHNSVKPAEKKELFLLNTSMCNHSHV